MDRVALDLGFIQIYWYSICLFVGMLAASFVIYREAKRRGIDDDTLINLTFSTILFGIIGARLYYVLFNLEYYITVILFCQHFYAPIFLGCNSYR